MFWIEHRTAHLLGKYSTSLGLWFSKFAVISVCARRHACVPMCTCVYVDCGVLTCLGTRVAIRKQVGSWFSSFTVASEERSQDIRFAEQVLLPEKPSCKHCLVVVVSVKVLLCSARWLTLTILLGTSITSVHHHAWLCCFLWLPVWSMQENTLVLTRELAREFESTGPWCLHFSL